MLIKSDYPINEDALRVIEVLTSEYNVSVSTEVDYNKSQVKNYLTDSIREKCRFCGKKKASHKVNFDSIAHAIPEFMGNKSLIAKFECDDCNQYFSQFENEFANFMLPYNALGGVKKKGNKYPKYKQDITVYHQKEDNIHVDNFPQELHQDTKEIELNLDIPSYLPDYIYRCLIKIGLTLIPENTVEKYQETLTWLMNISSDTIFPASMFFSVFPFSNPSNKIRCVIFTKKEYVKRQIPETLLILSYQNFSFQTYFPVSILENKDKLIPFPVIIPSSLDLNLNLAQSTSCKLIDLSKKEKVKTDRAEFIIKTI